MDLSLSCIMQVRLQLWILLHVTHLYPSTAESWEYSEAHRCMSRKFGFWLDTIAPGFPWGSRVACFTWCTGTLVWKWLIIKSTVHLVCRPWNYDLYTSGKLQNFFLPIVFLTNTVKRDWTTRTEFHVITSYVCFSFPHVLFFLAQVYYYESLCESD